jgi:hypothetical protein
MKIKIIIGTLLTTALIIVGYLIYLHSEPKINITSSNLNIDTEAEDDFLKNNRKIDYNKTHYLENIPVVYIKNNGYLAGLHHGKILKKQIREIVKILKHDILKSNTIKGFFTNSYLLQKAKQLDSHIPQVYREEIKGIAEGAEVSYNDILLIK